VKRLVKENLGPNFAACENKETQEWRKQETVLDQTWEKKGPAKIKEKDGYKGEGSASVFVPSGSNQKEEM